MARGAQAKNPLEPLLYRLTRDFVDDHDLTARIRDLFRVRPNCQSTGPRGYTSACGLISSLC